ncbi:MAG: type I methionyl aminopeptidase [Anaerolineae bacterium]
MNVAGVVIKSEREIALMRRAGQIVAKVLEAIRERVRPGITTGELDELAERIIRAEGGIPSFKGYDGGSGRPPYPASICASVDHEVVHGIPSPQRVLEEGQILSVDVGAIYRGYHGDAAITVPVGKVSDLARRLLEVTEGALYAGIAAARAGNRLGDISHAIQSYVESRGFSVIREYTGHGIGREMHEGLQVLNFGEPGRGVRLRAGMTLALEPMVNVGDWRTKVLEDGWTVVTYDGSLSAHFEHTILVRDGEAEILTRL